MSQPNYTIRPHGSPILSGHPILDGLVELLSNQGDLELIVADGQSYVIFAPMKGGKAYKFTEVENGYLLTEESFMEE